MKIDRLVKFSSNRSQKIRYLNLNAAEIKHLKMEYMIIINKSR